MARRLAWVPGLAAALVAAAAATLAPSAAASTCPAANGDAYSTAVLAAGPIAYYRLNETGGTEMCDSSTEANSGTYSSTSTLTFGVSGPILSGTDSGVQASGSGGIGQSNSSTPAGEITGNKSFTLEGWFKSTGTTQNQALVAMGGSSEGSLVGLTTWNDLACGESNAYNYESTLGLDENGVSNCWNTEYAYDGSGNPIDIYDGNWHFLAITYDESADTVTGYVDGQSLGSQTPTTSIDLASGPIRVGNWINTSVDKPLIGDASEVAVFPSALSASQIAAEYEDAVPSLGFATQSYQADITAAQDSPAGLPVTITRSTHATNPVTLSVDGLPSGVTVTSGTTIPAGSDSTVLWFSIAPSTTVGNYSITIDATSPDTAAAALDGELSVTASAASSSTDTTTAVACSPQLPTDGSPATCTATVTGSGASAPTGSVSFTASPSTGAFSDSAACTLAAVSGVDDTSSCELTFTPSTGGSYTVTGYYGGDDADNASDGSGTFVALDPTSTSVACPTSGVVVDDQITCTATVTDSAGTDAIYGSVEFGASPSTSLDPGECTEDTTASTTTVTCPVVFTPPDTGSYTVSAAYCGDAGASAPAACSGDETDWDGDHAPSTGSTTVDVSAAPGGTSTGPFPGGSGGSGGSGNGSGGSGPGSNPGAKATAGGLIKLGSKLSVSHRNRVVVPLTCKGTRGAECTGIVALVMDVEVVTKTPTLGHGTQREKYTIELGSAKFSVKAPSSTSVRLTLTKTALKIFKAAKDKTLAVVATATEFGAVVVEQKAKLATSGHAAKPKSKHRHKKKK